MVNNLYFFSIGSYNEKTLTLWNMSDFSVIQNKNVKFPIIDISIDYIYNYSLKDFSFTTITQHVLSLWKYSPSTKLQSVHFKQEDIEQEPEIGEFFLSIETTQYYEYVKSAYMLIGTNLGNVLMISKDNEMKIYYITKYKVDSGPLMHIKYYNNRKLVIADGRGKIFIWKESEMKQPSDKMFEYINDIKEKRVTNICESECGLNSMYIEDGDMMLCSTDRGEVYYIKEENEKMISKRIIKNSLCDTNVLNIDIDKEGNIYSLSDSGVINIWEGDNSFDLKGCIILNHTEQDEDNGIQKKIIQFIIKTSFIICLIDVKSSITDTYFSIYDLTTNKPIGTFSPIDNTTIKDKNDFEYITSIYTDSNIILSLSNKNNIYYLELSDLSSLSIYSCQLIYKDQTKVVNDKYIVYLSYDSSSNYISISYSDTSISLSSIESVDTKRNLSLPKDTFNLLSYYLGQSDDSESHSLKLRYNAMQKTSFGLITKTFFESSTQLIIYNEIIQYITIRNFITKEFIKSIPLNGYHPITLSMKAPYYIIGTKEGVIVKITKKNKETYKGLSIDIINIHYDQVNKVIIDNDCAVTCSYNEIAVNDLS